MGKKAGVCSVLFFGSGLVSVSGRTPHAMPFLSFVHSSFDILESSSQNNSAWGKVTLVVKGLDKRLALRSWKARGLRQPYWSSSKIPEKSVIDT